MNNNDNKPNMRDIKGAKLEGARGFNKALKLELPNPENNGIRMPDLGRGNVLKKYDGLDATERDLIGDNNVAARGGGGDISANIETISVCVNGSVKSVDFYVV